jgi:hypothetical protein
MAAQAIGTRRTRRGARACALVAALSALAGCGNWQPFGRENVLTQPVSADADIPAQFDPRLDDDTGEERETIWDLFVNTDDPNVTLEVNRYIWNATLDVLNFLPLETVDPFSGVIVTGYGVPPGGGRAYRATVQVRDPALDARALNVALATRSGPVDPDTVRAVEDAILTRARQLRIADGRL